MGVNVIIFWGIEWSDKSNTAPSLGIVEAETDCASVPLGIALADCELDFMIASRIRLCHR